MKMAINKTTGENVTRQYTACKQPGCNVCMSIYINYSIKTKIKNTTIARSCFCSKFKTSAGL